MGDPDPTSSLFLSQAYGGLGHLDVGGYADDAIEVLAVCHSPKYDPDPMLATERSPHRAHS